MSGLILKNISSNDLLCPHTRKKPNRQLIASGVNRANGLQIGTLTIRALAQKMFSPACPAADFPAVADFYMVGHALAHQKSVIIQYGAAIGGWYSTVGVFAREPGTVSVETVVLSLSPRGPF